MLGILIGGLFTFMFGGLVLIVILGARRVEDELQERQKEKIGEIRARAARTPRFLVVSPPTSPRVARPDESLLGQVQQYLETEQVLADEFVLQPSIERLYRESGRRITGH